LHVLRGHLPRTIEHRSWKPEREAPIVVNVYDWTTYTLLFSVMIWPPVDVTANTPEKAENYKLQRAEGVMAAITRGAAGMSWSLLYETEERLSWDKRRAVWVTHDGVAYEYPKRSLQTQENDEGQGVAS
jgi:hypothetical protein